MQVRVSKIQLGSPSHNCLTKEIRPSELSSLFQRLNLNPAKNFDIKIFSAPGFIWFIRLIIYFYFDDLI